MASQLKPILLIVVLTLAAFVNTLDNDFVGDAKSIFEDNTFYKNPHNISRLLDRSFINAPRQMLSLPHQQASFSGCISYRPVTALTFFADYAAWKNNPFGHHLTNVLLHLTVVLLCYFYLRLLTGLDAVALLASLIFAVHPVQSEVVSSIGYRSDLLLGIFSLLYLLLHHRAQTVRGPARFLTLTAGQAALVLALFSKETAIMLPVLALLQDLTLGEADRSGTRFREYLAHHKGPFVSAALILAGYLFVYFVLIPSQHYTGFFTDRIDWARQSLLMVKVFGRYLLALFVPFTVHLLPTMYAPVLTPFNLYDLLTVILAAAPLIYALRSFSRHRRLSYGIFWFYLTYLPASNIMLLPNPIAYRFLYLPLIGFALVTALLTEKAIFQLKRRIRSFDPSPVVKVLLVGLLITWTLPLNDQFQNTRVSCLNMVRHYPQASRPYWILGLSYFDGKDYRRAEHYFQEYLKRDTNNPFVPKMEYVVYHYLGMCQVGNPDAAIEYFRRSAQLRPDYFPVYHDLARACILKGDFETALQYVAQAVKVRPDVLPPYVYAVHCYAELGRFEEAEDLLARMKKQWPGEEAVGYAQDFLRSKEAPQQ